MKRLFNFLLLVGLCALTNCDRPAPGHTSHNFPTSSTIGEYGNRLDSLFSDHLNSVFNDFDLPGLVFGVVADDTLVYARALGVQDIRTGEPLNLLTNFHMASISKPFVATAVMQLVEEGKVELDSPLVEYVPYFKVDDERHDELTVQQFLSHVSGMPDVEDYEWYNPQYDVQAIPRYVKSLGEEKLEFAPGTSFSYSNMAFECLGAMIHEVTGQSFADYEQEHILEVAQMENSTFLKPDSLPANWAAGHSRDFSTRVISHYPYNRRHGPSSTLHSNILDMAKWARINMNRGSLHGNRILRDDAYDQLWKRWYDFGNNNGVGLSWFLNDYKGRQMVRHSGGDDGFSTELVMFPDQGIAVFAMCNADFSPIEPLVYQAVAILLEEEVKLSISKPASIPVMQVLKATDVAAARALWDSLQTYHKEEYYFGPYQFAGLIHAIETDRLKDAQPMAELCLEILGPEMIGYVTQVVQGISKRDPENETSKAILALMANNTAE